MAGTANGSNNIITLDDANRAVAIGLVLAAIDAIDDYAVRLRTAIKEIDEAAEQLQTNISFLNSSRGRFIFDLANIEPDPAINEVLKRNGLEIVRNGNAD